MLICEIREQVLKRDIVFVIHRSGKWEKVSYFTQVKSGID